MATAKKKVSRPKKATIKKTKTEEVFPRLIEIDSRDISSLDDYVYDRIGTVFKDGCEILVIKLLEKSN